MLALARTGAAEGLWLRAERQMSGRGRQGRAWVSPVGNLSASTLVRLRPHDPQAATLALVVGVALEETVGAYLRASPPHARLFAAPPGSPDLRLKWPNDLLIDGAKLSGVLLERTDDAVVIGIGVNLAHHPDMLDRATTSLAMHGAAPDPADFLVTLADAVARWLARWRSEGLAPIRLRWLERAHPIGTALTAYLPDGAAVDGLFQGLDAHGALVLRLADGTTRVIHAGDVFLI